ncbi:Luciferase-like monooxygenase [Saccharopolyspora kobensis]|uniref:Luciferase-like monooxygenase n=2 Tax=Saccharopolyspora kobensis TaxID=146035 RepID=A0A1H6E5N4_9PSEU|nr:Luciferase-like monooxygenase [Saccharopolyspora kobensis]SFD39169.1 Luciferase-like monooxygenase [Saccharopolyspora kobensis]
MRHALYLPPFGELADPGVLAELSARAEAAGFDGVFLWDHVVRPRQPGLGVCDPWIALAAIAARTERIRIGTRITPLSRRRPHDVARQAAAVDQLSAGRLVLGVGLGADNGGELSRLGEADDPRTRAEMLDEGLDVICALWSGEPVTHRGRHFRVDGLRFLPRPVQRPRIPIWVAAQSVKRAPLHRAARFDGLCPETTPDGLRAMLDVVARHRGGLDGYEVAVGGPPDDDPGPFRAAGASWWLVQFPEITTVAEVEAAISR